MSYSSNSKVLKCSPSLIFVWVIIKFAFVKKIFPRQLSETSYGSYEYTVMSFGLVNAPPTFTRLMNFIFNPYTNEFVLVYLDDILVFSKNRKDHAIHLRLVLDKLREYQLYAKFSKCEFWLDEVLYLGHIISAKGIAVNPEKVSVVVNW